MDLLHLNQFKALRQEGKNQGFRITTQGESLPGCLDDLPVIKDEPGRAGHRVPICLRHFVSVVASLPFPLHVGESGLFPAQGA